MNEFEERSFEDYMHIVGSVILIGVGVYLVAKLGYKVPGWLKAGYAKVKAELEKQKALQDQQEKVKKEKEAA